MFPVDHDTTKLINKINEILQLKKIYFDKGKNIEIIIIITIIIIIIINHNYNKILKKLEFLLF